jgi:hypothetical protein
MKNSENIWISLGLLFSACCIHEVAHSDGQAKTDFTFIAEKYNDDFSTLSAHGYKSTGSRTLSVSKSSPVNENLSLLSYCRKYSKSKGFDCVWVIAERIGQIDGRPEYKVGEMLRLKLPPPFALFESDDTLCKSTGFPSSHILTVGIWKWRSKPAVGGFAHSLKKAWRIDVAAMQFREISLNGVACVINADRN